MIKSLNKQGIEGMYLNIIKATYDKPIANIILNGEKLKPFSLNSGTRQGYPLSPVLLNIVLQFLTRVIRQEEEMKRIQIGKETVKITLFVVNVIQYLKDSKNYTQKFLENIISFSNVPENKINLQKSVTFLYTNIQHIEKECRKTIAFIIASKKNLMPRSKLNEGCK
jgi:hypothetical protein